MDTLKNTLKILALLWLASGCFGGGTELDGEKTAAPTSSEPEVEQNVASLSDYKGDKNVHLAGGLMIEQAAADLEAVNIGLSSSDIENMKSAASDELAVAGALAIGIKPAQLSLTWGSTSLKKEAQRKANLNPLYEAANAVTGSMITEIIALNSIDESTKRTAVEVLALSIIKAQAKAFEHEELKEKLKPEQNYATLSKVAINVSKSITNLGSKKEQIKDFAKTFLTGMVSETKIQNLKSDRSENINSVISGFAMGSATIEVSDIKADDELHPKRQMRELLMETYAKENNMTLNPESYEDFEVFAEEILKDSALTGESEDISLAVEFVTHEAIVSYDASPTEVKNTLGTLNEVYAEDESLVPPDDMTEIIAQKELYSGLESDGVITAEETAFYEEATNDISAAIAEGDKDSDGDGVLDSEDLFPEDPSESTDFDGDGKGDTADTDDDNDGVLDADELAAGSDPYNPDSDSDGVSDFDDPRPLDPNAIKHFNWAIQLLRGLG